MKRPPVYIFGMAQGHPGGDPMETLVSGAPIAKETAFKMADITLNDVDFCEIYDCYTFTVLVTLEDYGFCKKGEGGPFVAGGAIGPGGSIPVNTGGGQLSSFYMWGMTPVSEAIVQIRGEAAGGRCPNTRLDSFPATAVSLLHIRPSSSDRIPERQGADCYALATLRGGTSTLCRQSANRFQQSRPRCASSSTARRQAA